MTDNTKKFIKDTEAFRKIMRADQIQEIRDLLYSKLNINDFEKIDEILKENYNNDEFFKILWQ
jgi:hypothetical protein